MKAYLRLIAFSSLVLLYFINTAPLYFFIKYFPYKVRYLTSRICQIYAKITLWVLGIKYQANDRKSNTNNLIVANHLSYVDILIMAAIKPTCFVTSIEIKKTPFLGQICELAGCLYVERRSRDNLDVEVKDISNALINGLNVTIFPEATSTNGDCLKKFKRPLFASCRFSHRKVKPASINYTKINKSVVGIDNRDKIFWYGDMKFGSHIWNLMKLDSIEAEVIFNNEVTHDCETELSLLAYNSVNENFVSIA